jgi:ATP-dependent 26S proteasome regulatory subunit
MNYNDFMINNMLFTSFSKINSGYIVFDLACVIILSTLLSVSRNYEFKNKIFGYVEDFYSFYNKTNKIIFSSSNKEDSKRYRAIMHFISKQNDPSVKRLIETIDKKYCSKSDDYRETKSSVYRVDQINDFTIDKNIMGSVYYKEKEIGNGEFKKIDQIKFIEIFSQKLKLTELQEWVEEKLYEFDIYIRDKTLNSQLLIHVGWDPKEKDLDIYSNNWQSNVRFENRFFTDKDKIISKIDFFLNNPDWYKQRGIPYTLGFLLHGEPGCGKTGFIKSLMNLTGRHGLSIKLNNSFDMNKLRELIFDEEISNDLIIAPEKRIIIFEDIDCMGDIVKDRDIVSKTNNNDLKINKKLKKIFSDEDEDDESDDKILVNIDSNSKTNNYNNNLSHFLNIIDGLQESLGGRIIVMTTNKPEILDKALIRPGRIDYNINFTKATVSDIVNILNHYWETKIDSSEILSDQNLKYSHADIVNKCRISVNIKECIEKINL